MLAEISEYIHVFSHSESPETLKADELGDSIQEKDQRGKTLKSWVKFIVHLIKNQYKYQ